MVELFDDVYDLGSREATTLHKRIILKRDNDPVELRELMPEDSEKLYELFSSSRKHIKRFLPEFVKHLKSLSDMRKRILSVLNNNNLYSFGIWDEDILVGEQKLYIEPDNSAETVTWVGIDHTRNHYGTKARALIIDFAFNQLGIEKLISKVSVNNTAGRKIIEGSDYTYVGKELGLRKYVLSNPNLAS